MNTNQPKILHQELAYNIVGHAMQVHSKLGNGFLEKVYENALMVYFAKQELRQFSKRRFL